MKRSVEVALRLLAVQATDWGLKLAPSQVALLGRYAEVLSNYDRANVIGTKDSRAILLEHVVDSLSCALTGRVVSGCQLVDVGSGGGLPGIPVAIAAPDADVTLIEAASKKVAFLEMVVQDLGLANVGVVRGRVEEVGRDTAHRDAYDVAVTRAVAALPVVVEYCAPLTRPGGHIIAMRAGLEPEETEAGERAAADLGARPDGIKKVGYAPGMAQKERNLVVFGKHARTPKKFPRRVGSAKQRPLGQRSKR